MIMVSQKVPTCSKNMFQITLWWTKTSFRVREILRGDFYFSQWSRTYGDNNKILYSISSVLDWWSLKPKWSYYWSYRLISNHRYKPLKKNTNFFLNERASVNISRDDWSGCLKGSEGIFSYFLETIRCTVPSAWERRLISLVLTSVLESPFYIKKIKFDKICTGRNLFIAGTLAWNFERKINITSLDGRERAT